MNRWALVTGSAKRIGRAIALELAAQDWNIIVHFNHSADEAEQVGEEIVDLGRKAVLAQIDIANADHVAKLIPSLSAELGPITALVNNASLFEPDAKDPDGTLHKAINADAPRLLSEAFVKQIPANGKGCIVNLLDGLPPDRGFDHYNRSKQTLRAETLAAAKRFAPRVRVNGIAPGATLAGVRESEAHFEKLVASSLLKTRIDPADVARAVHFLISSPTITGEILHVDGGVHLKNDSN